jgi:coenzyme A diphosphatase NUDT7
MNSYH